MNKIILIGNLTKDPEMRTTQNGISVCSFTIAVNRRRTANEPVTDFFRINAWRNLGETCAKYLAKGRKVHVIGELQPHTYKAKNGENMMSLDVNADEVEFLSVIEKKPAEDDFTDLNVDDLPF